MRRNRLALVLFALIALVSIDPVLLRSFATPPGDPLASDRYEHFLQRVRQHTRPGDSVALIVPPPGKQGEYEFYRASYVLSGRTVLPVVGSRGVVHPSNLAEATYVAVWRVRAEGLNRPVIWSVGGGQFLGPR